MPEQEFINLHLASIKVAKLLKKALKPKTGKIGSVIYGLDVDHTHIHLVPLDKPGDLSFSNKHEASKEELEEALKEVTTS